jgi:S-adenosylmethionine synthetase
MGRKPKNVKKSFKSSSGEIKEFEVELFTWEKLDYVDIIKKKLK